MKPPKFTDSDRFPDAPYSPARETDITKSWQRERERIELERKKRAEIVKEIRKIGARK